MLYRLCRNVYKRQLSGSNTRRHLPRKLTGESVQPGPRLVSVDRYSYDSIPATRGSPACPTAEKGLRASRKPVGLHDRKGSTAAWILFPLTLSRMEHGKCRRGLSHQVPGLCAWTAARKQSGGARLSSAVKAFREFPGCRRRKFSFRSEGKTAASAWGCKDLASHRSH